MSAANTTTNVPVASEVDCCQLEKTNKILIFVMSIKRSSDNGERMYIARTFDQFQDFRQVLKLPDDIVNGQTVYEFFSQNQSNTQEGVLTKPERSSDKRRTSSSDKGKSDVSRVPSREPEIIKGTSLVEDPVVYTEVPVDTAPVPERFKVVPRTGAYEEIIIIDDMPTHKTVDSKSNTETTDPDATLYASVVKNPDLERRKSLNPPPSPPVIYADVYSVNVDQPRLTSDTPEDGTIELQEDYCNIDGLHRNSNSNNRDSDAYAEITTPTPSHVPPVPMHVPPTPTLISPPVPTPRAATTASTKPPNIALQQSQSGSTQPSAALRSPGPLTPIPPMPEFAPPTLDVPHEEFENVVAAIGEEGEVQIAAIADYSSSSENILSFKKGALGTLVVQSDTAWWCVRIKNHCGWVAASYWRTLNSGDCGSLSSRNGSAPWFSGKLSRNDCESLLMQHGKQKHFFVRESTNVVGRYALSVRYNDRVHHFPIELTPDNKYNIGKHDFKSITNVISYYKRYALFYDDNGVGVTLGSPLVIAEEKSVKAAS